MRAEYCSEWLTRDGEEVIVTSLANVNLEKMIGNIESYATELDREWGTERCDELEELLKEYFVINNKKYTAVSSDWNEYIKSNKENLDDYDKYHNGVIVYSRD